jgi:hypothetical protein
MTNVQFSQACKSQTREHNASLRALSLLRGQTRERIELGLGVCHLQLFSRCPSTQSAESQGTEAVQHIENVHVPACSKEGIGPALQAMATDTDSTRAWIKTRILLRRIAQNSVTEVKHGRESVRKVQDARSGDDTSESTKVGNGGTDDEGTSPVNGNDGNPDELARANRQRGGGENLLEDILIDDYKYC